MHEKKADKYEREGKERNARDFLQGWGGIDCPLSFAVIGCNLLGNSRAGLNPQDCVCVYRNSIEIRHRERCQSPGLFSISLGSH